MNGNMEYMSLHTPTEVGKIVIDCTPYLVLANMKARNVDPGFDIRHYITAMGIDPIITGALQFDISAFTNIDIAFDRMNLKYEILDQYYDQIGVHMSDFESHFNQSLMIFIEELMIRVLENAIENLYDLYIATLVRSEHKSVQLDLHTDTVNITPYGTYQIQLEYLVRGYKTGY